MNQRLNMSPADAAPAHGGAQHLPHICFVAPHIWPVLSGSRDLPLVGGAEVQQSHLARALAAAGHRVTVLSLDFGQGAEATLDGLRVLGLHRPEAGLRGLRFLHPRLTGLWRGLHAADADIYYQRGADMHTGVVAAFCRRQRRKAVFAGACNADFQSGGQLIRFARDRRLFEYGLRRVDAVVAQNPAQQRMSREHYGREATLIHSCYPQPASSDPTGRREVLWVGTLRSFKFPERFIELARRLPQYRCTMIGGPGGKDAQQTAYFDRLRDMAAQVPNLAFLGFIHPQEVEAHFDRARVFVNTSDVEGFPNTFLQAWARGVPTVSLFDTGSRHRGEAIGTVVADMAQAAEAIERMMRDDTLVDALGLRAQEYYTDVHSVPSVLASYQSLFQQLAGPP